MAVKDLQTKVQVAENRRVKFCPRVFVVLLPVFAPFCGWAQPAHHIAAANIVVVQNDTNNVATSVTVSTSLSINDFRIRTGSNRADYNVQIGPTSTDDVAGGILMTSIDQNGRDNGEWDTFPGMNYGTAAIDSNASGSPGSSGEYWIPVFQLPNNAEYNFNVAAAWFPYSDGWYGGWLNNATGVNGGANNHLIGNPNLVLGTHVIDQGSGKTKVDLRPFGLDSRTNAILLVEGGKNEANFALSATNGDGTWTITCHDDNGGAEQDYIGFVCIPLTNHSVVSGRFLGDTSIAMASEPYTVTQPGLGTYHLSIPGVNPANGVLIISAESGGTVNGDNVVSYQASGDGWDIQTRDITAGYTPALQNLDVSNAVVSFVYIPGPTPGLTALRWSGVPTNTWDLSANEVWRSTADNSPTNYADACTVIFDDSASNFTVNVSASVAPFQTTVSNISHAYAISGAGLVLGSGGLTKRGSGKLTLAAACQYTGTTILSQGTLQLGASGCIPGGQGYGDAVISGTLDLAGYDCVLNNLSGSGIVDNVAAGGSPRLRLFQTTNSIFSGNLKNSSGALAVVLDGGSSLTLAGNSSVAGGCVVSNGTLVVKATLVTSSVQVQSGACLGGNATVNGPVTLADGSGLNLIANSPLTVGATTLNGAVTVNVTGVSFGGPGTYLLLRHGALGGGGSFKLVQPPGLQASGLVAALSDTGSQLQLVVTTAPTTGTIADVRHVVILMDENRAFDHYFGTLNGVRGFNDRNAILFTNGNSVFYQPSNTTYELPFHNSIQCLTDLNHTWPVTHATVNNGRNDRWIPNKGAETMCYYQRSDLPYFYALADAYTICDEYHCSVLSSTDPNRVTLMTGTIDPHGLGGGPQMDNSELDSGFTWKTYPEMLQDAGISWKVYLVSGDSSDNVLPRFAAFKQAAPGNPLYDRGRAGYSGLTAMVNGFSSDVANNTLPAVSWIIGPGAYTEHPPSSPANGQVLLKQILDALAANPQVYNSTVFIFNYDENDGFYDHAMPILPPLGTADEFVGSLPIGLGIRVPALMISPWSRGGRVCSQVFDHTSVIRFLEKWTGVIDPNISAWRRQVCGDLTSAFDFAHPDFDYPVIPGVSTVSCPSGSTPAVPSPQVFPSQETGSRVALPLPYQPNASCSLNLAAGTITVNMTNSGAASVHFGVYANAYRGDGPWPYDVNTTNSASATFSTAATAGRYDFSCHGPNGFQRRFAGNITNDFQKIEVAAVLNPASGGLRLLLANASSSAVTFGLTNGYSASAASYLVPAHSTNIVEVGSETNSGFYDVTVVADADALFLRRFLGRVEKYGLPAVSSGGFLAGGAFEFTYGGPFGQPYKILSSTNVADPASWTVVHSGNFSSAPETYTELNATSQLARFYRLVSP